MQWFDEANNIMERMEITNSNIIGNKKSLRGHPSIQPLTEVKYHYDEWNRIYRIDKHGTLNPAGKN